MAKIAYELTPPEVKLIEGWRQGKVVLDGNLWLKVSPKEGEVVELWRKIRFGTLLIEFYRGEPSTSKILMEFRHGAPDDRSEALKLLSIAL